MDMVFLREEEESVWEKRGEKKKEGEEGKGAGALGLKVKRSPVMAIRGFFRGIGICRCAHFFGCE